jgi:hypothetical protein
MERTNVEAPVGAHTSFGGHNQYVLPTFLGHEFTVLPICGDILVAGDEHGMNTQISRKGTINGHVTKSPKRQIPRRLNFLEDLCSI